MRCVAGVYVIAVSTEPVLALQRRPAWTLFVGVEGREVVCCSERNCLTLFGIWVSVVDGTATRSIRGIGEEKCKSRQDAMACRASAASCSHDGSLLGVNGRAMAGGST